MTWVETTSSPRTSSVTAGSDNVDIGVALATYIQRYQRYADKKDLTRKTAILLGGELHAIQRLCERFLKQDAEMLAKVKASSQTGVTLVVTIGDPHFPRTIYDKPSTDVGLFPDILAATIAELYRYLDLTKEAKLSANGFSAELSEIMTRLQRPDLTPIQKANEEQKRMLAEKGFVRYTETFYMFYLNNISKMVAACLEDLKQIEGVVPSLEATDPKDALEQPNKG